MPADQSPTRVFAKRAPGPRRVIQTNTSTLFLVLTLALVMMGFVEIAVAFPLTTGMTVFYGLICTFLFIPFVMLDRSVVKLLLLALFYVGLITIHLVPWNIRKPFLHDLRKVRAGMSVDEVDTTMDRWVIDATPTNADWIVLGEGDDFILYRPGSDDERFRDDYGLVRFHQGRVTAVHTGQR